MFSFLRKIRNANRPRCTALVAAAGDSRRMGGVNKLLEPLDGVPVLVRTLTALQIAQEIDEIIVAAREEDLVEISRLCHTYGIAKCAKVVRGGESRAHSVLLAALEASPESELLAVQDGARPLVTPELIGRTVAAAARCGAGQFILLLPQADYDASRAVCARLVRNFTRRYPHSPLRLTFFVQTLPPGGAV